MSDATCTALQLINFWQDVRRDLLERDRVYLPSIETGVTPQDLRAWIDRGNDPSARVRYICALRPLVDRTAELFALGRPLPGLLDPRLAPIVRLFGLGGEAILSAVQHAGCTTLWHRPRISKARKVWLVGRAMVEARFAARPGGPEPRSQGIPA
jgi:phytoene/squalene synthetase